MWSVSAIPRHSFISWLAFRNRLATGGRKLHWGYLGTTQPVCSVGDVKRVEIAHFFIVSSPEEFGKSCRNAVWSGIQ